MFTDFLKKYIYINLNIQFTRELMAEVIVYSIIGNVKYRLWSSNHTSVVIFGPMSLYPGTFELKTVLMQLSVISQSVVSIQYTDTDKKA